MGVTYAPPLFGGKGPVGLPWQPLPYMDEFLTNLEVDGSAPEYVRVVKVGLTHFTRFLRAEGVRHPDEIERTHILRFQVYLNELTSTKGEPLSIRYRQQILKYVRAWINWLESVEHIERNPWVRIKVGQTPKKPKPLEEEEVAQLFAAHLNQAFTRPPFYFHRTEVILVLLYGWGLRIHELHSLDVEALDMRLDFVTVRNKGRRDAANKTKSEPYGTEIKAVVARWLSHRSRYAKVGENALLIDQQGNRLSIAMIRTVISDLGERAGVNVNPHRLRDTFGTTMLDGDVPLERIMKMMGHTKREQTLAYARVNDPKLLESHENVMTPLLNKLLGGQLP